MKTHSMAQEVIDRAELDMSTNDLLGKLFVTADDSTFTIKIEVRSTAPEEAYAIVDTVATVFTEERDAWNQKQDKRDRVDVKMMDRVYSLGYTLYRPKTSINTLAGGIFGVMMGVLVIFFLEWLERDRIRNSNDVEEILNVMVLGNIPAHVHSEKKQEAQ